MKQIINRITLNRLGDIANVEEYAYTAEKLGMAINIIEYGYTDTNWKDKLTSYDGEAITYDEIGNPQHIEDIL